MKASPITVTALEITEAPALDPIRVFMQDFGKGQGRLILECYGRAWSCFWPAMGSDLRTFIIEAEPSYIENAMHSGQNPRKVDRQYLQRIVQALQTTLRASPQDKNAIMDDLVRLHPVPWEVDSFPHQDPKLSKATIYAADSNRIAETTGEHAHALAHLIADSVNHYLPNKTSPSQGATE